LRVGAVVVAGVGTAVPSTAPTELSYRLRRFEMEAKVGDRIAVESERVGQPAREGKVLEVLSPGLAVHYRARWADDHETVFFPHAGNTSVITKRSRARST
jgi:hypothetical protein